MSRQRVTDAYVEKLLQTLPPRDLDMVQTLDRLRLATGKQLRRLHFMGGTKPSDARQAQRRLRALTQSRVLQVLDRSVGGPGGGSAQTVYALDTAGQRLASASGPAGGARLRRPWTPGLLFLRHTLAVSEIYVRLVEVSAGGSTELLAFDAEPDCWRSFTGSGGARKTLKPDAFVRTARADWEFAFFVEVDRATASVPTLIRKFRSYRAYFQTGREQERLGLFPRVLVLVPDARRQAAVVEAMAALQGDAWDLFRVMPYADALPTLCGDDL